MLEGQLVRLRAIEPGDLEREYVWINDLEVTRYLTARYPMSRADEERWIQSASPNSFAQGVRLAIETKEGEHIGNIDLHRMHSEDRKAGLGVMIGNKEYWGNGYGTDAITTLLRFAFYEQNLNRVWLTVFDDNDRAMACYRKCGFVEEARQRQDVYMEGRYRDVLFMGVLRRDFDALHGGPGGEPDA
ncbi:MAG: GNAT family protein [Dehalococcoidia bacterium]